MTRSSASKALSANKVSGLAPGAEARRHLADHGIARSQEERQRISKGVDHGTDFGAQSAFARPDRLVFAVFFWAPALC